MKKIICDGCGQENAIEDRAVLKVVGLSLPMCDDSVAELSWDLCETCAHRLYRRSIKDLLK